MKMLGTTVKEVLQSCSPVVEQPWHKPEHSQLLNTKVKNSWNITSTLLVGLHACPGTTYVWKHGCSYLGDWNSRAVLDNYRFCFYIHHLLPSKKRIWIYSYWNLVIYRWWGLSWMWWNSGTSGGNWWWCRSVWYVIPEDICCALHRINRITVYMWVCNDNTNLLQLTASVGLKQALLNANIFYVVGHLKTLQLVFLCTIFYILLWSN
jgi:hypothetical protein